MSARGYIAWLAAVLCLVSAGCGKKQEPVVQGSLVSPGAASTAFDERNLAELYSRYPSAILKPQPWAGYWWPYVGAGIASVWRDGAGMSAADKYDAAYLSFLKSRGLDASRFEPAADWERSRHGPGLLKVESWWGHCNGWSAASIMVPEPKGPETIQGITFDVRDQKALLTESWMEFSGDFIGTRVDDKNDFGSAAFWDVVPAQFHLILSNIAGRQNRGLILDRHTGHEIWNQPLVAYEIEPIRPENYLGPHPAYPDIYRVDVAARIWWANDNVDPDDVTPVFDKERLENEYFDYYFPGRRLFYELWLDGPVEFDANGKMVKSGNILVTKDGDRYVGGVWKNGDSPAALINTHPDFMWIPFGVQRTSGYKNTRIDDNWIRDNIGAPRS